MDYPDDGASTPDAGAMRDDASRLAGIRPSGRVETDAPSLAQAIPHGQFSAQVAVAALAGQSFDRANSLDGKGHGTGRKRRKRKRGRKVFAREDERQPGAVQPNAPRTQPTNFRAPAATLPAKTPDARMEAGITQPAVNADTQTKTAEPRTPNAPTSAKSFPAGGRDTPVYAALDLGTNNCRLLVAIPTRPGHFRVVDAFSRIVRLGEGLTASGRLSDAAMDRAVEALKVCAEKLSLHRIGSARLVATEACRAAANGEAFLARVRRETGLALEIIDRETEARLAVSGCGSLVEPETQGLVLFDIGGGSSEIALVDLTGQRSPRLASHIVAWTSLPVGVVSLAERFGGAEVTPASFAAMQAYVADLLTRFPERGRLAAIQAGPGFHLLGTSGTVTTLAGIHLGLERYDRRKVDGLWLDDTDVERITARLLGWSFAERVANACIGPDRADLVLAGCAILEAIRVVWPAKRLRVADRGLREGILSELMAADGAWRRQRRPYAG